MNDNRPEGLEAADADYSARYRTLFDSIDEGFCIIEFFDGPHGPLSDYVHVEANPAYATNAGIPDVVGQKVREMVPDEADGWVALYGDVLRTGEPIRFERELVATGRHLELSAFRIEPAARKQVAVLFKDVTARKRAELELRRLNETLEARVAQAIAERMQEQERLREAEAALRQAQKMEAVGQLTGGLAHDFNNLLAGISGAFEMIGVRLAQGRSADVEKYLSAGQRATRRAAALTHRLLAFSRRQTLQPKPVNINRLMSEFVELVRRTVGPAIEVETVAAGGLWLTMVDPNQLENALLNLCINARDAMPNGGKITIETANRWLDERTALSRTLDPGQYVTVCVSDTGSGIDKAILDRVFDPFFTTKPMGEGTGLGLSMVYGFARQSHGHVRIYSEVGQGTMVCIYLPRHVGDEATDEAPGSASVSRTEAGETVLIVDDEPTIRMLVTDSLGDLGYACKEAADGASGLKILQSPERIDLLITDIGLPGGLNGRQLADAARVTRPDLKVLFITGYAENAVFNHGHVERGMEVMTKPFAVEQLASRVERMLKES
jgi:signal transduction histidine kinase/ActR/RegA family two-component response regulator